MARSGSTTSTAHTVEPITGADGRSAYSLLITSLRPEQWTKNCLVFAGLVFGGKLLDLDAVLIATAAFVIFCALSGATYLVNDVADRDTDRRHPLKRTR